MKVKNEGKIINIRPIAISAIVMIAGIVLAYYMVGRSIFPLIYVFISIFAFLLAIFVFPFKKKKATIIFTTILTLIFFIGFFNVYIRYNIVDNLPSYSGEGFVTGNVVKCNLYDSGYSVNIENCTFKDQKLDGQTTVFIPKNKINSIPDIGCKIGFKCEIKNNLIYKDKIYQTLSGTYYKGILRSKVEIIDLKPHFYQIAFLKLRDFFIENLSEETAPFAIALTTGDTTFLKEERLKAFQMAGIAHVFAVSGLHIGLFVSVFTFIARKLKLKRLSTLIFVFIPAFLYCGLCGFRLSALRALIMATVILVSYVIGFKNDGISSCSLASIILLLINPMSIFNVGFKLSFIAVTSIFTLAPLFTRGLKPLKKVGSALAVSLAAQLGTLPLLTDMSGYMSIIAVFANLIFVPLVSLCYVLILLFTIFGLLESAIFGIAKVTMFLPDKILYFVSHVISLINFKLFIVHSYFGNIKYLWYSGLFVLSDLVNLKLRYKLLIFGCVSIITFAFIFIV